MLLKELRDVGEFYLAYRILSVAMTGLVLLIGLIFGPNVIAWILIGAVCFLIAMIPFILLWAVVVFFNGLRRM